MHLVAGQQFFKIKQGCFQETVAFEISLPASLVPGARILACRGRRTRGEIVDYALPLNHVGGNHAPGLGIRSGCAVKISIRLIEQVTQLRRIIFRIGIL